MMHALSDAVTTNGTLTAAMGKVMERAKAGDPWAIDFIFDRLIGKPTQRTQIAITEAVKGLIADWDKELSGSDSAIDQTTSKPPPTMTPPD
jgi:hypothetical protein